MRISDWSSDVCSSDLRGWHSRASCAGLYWRYATERGIGASLAKRMCSEASSDASPVRAFLCPARTRPVDQPEHIGESGALRFARPARRQTRRTEIGRATRRERVLQYVYFSVDAVSLTEKYALSINCNETK